MYYIQPVIIGIVKKDNKYLLTKRQESDLEDSQFNGKWQFPGGGLEFGEDVEACLFRELKEEIGVDVRIVGLVPKVFSSVRKGWQGIFITYLCELTSPDDPIVINEEASEFGWFSLEEIAQLDRLVWTKMMVDAADSMQS